MNISLNQLKVFTVVARKCNFTRAADELFMSQPAVSVQMRLLERTVGVKLFEQIGKRLFLTEAGQGFLRYASEIVGLTEDLEKVVIDIRDTPSGELRLAATNSLAIYLFPAVLNISYSTCNSLRVRIFTRRISEIIEGVLHNEWDMGLVPSSIDCPEPHHQELQFEELFRDQLAVIVGSSHKWANRSRIEPAEVADQPAVTYPRGSGIRKIIDEELSRYGVALNALVESNNTEVIKYVVGLGIGIGFVNQLSVLERLEVRPYSPKLTVLKVSNLDLRYGVNLVTHQSKYRTAAIRAFCDLLHVHASSISSKSVCSEAVL